MYNPAHFTESRPEVLHAAIAQHPLATLVTLGPAGLSASHLPLLYQPIEGGLGLLRGHLAKANPQWRDHLPGTEALAIFAGPQHYVSPNWYPSKQEHGKVVPTWNYVAVHAHATVDFKDDAAWLLETVRLLTDSQERRLSGNPWHVSDAPAEFIDKQLTAIVGVELTITRLEGKWKLSQNRPAEDREGVISGLARQNSPEADAMAELLRDRR